MNLLEEAKAGNKEAFEQLILDNQYAIYKTARVFFQEESEINLSLERTLYVSFREIRSCKSEDNFLVWILNQLILTCSSLEESKAKYPRALPPANPFTSYEEYKENSIVEQCISKLEVELRLPALLYFYIHLSIKDIAKLVRISENETNKRIEKARESLYEIIEKYNNDQNLNSNNNY
jgi:RNA polymerase sigma-70 factor (ECF subfamily)